MTALLTSGTLSVRASRLNPVTKIVALVVLSLPVLVTGNPYVAAVLIAAQVVALPVLGLGPRVLARYAWPFLLGLVGIWLANYLASGDIGVVLPITARLVALALPGLVLVLSTEPVELADALVQVWHAPPRFAYGALAAFRLIPLLGAEWTSMRGARRARGLSPGANPVRAAHLAAGLLFGLLVAAIRRGVRLAVAMDARGFDTSAPRTSARPSRLGRADVAVIAGAVLLALVSLLALGISRPH